MGTYRNLYAEESELMSGSVDRRTCTFERNTNSSVRDDLIGSRRSKNPNLAIGAQIFVT